MTTKKITSIIYKFIIISINRLPVSIRNFILRSIRFLHIPNNKFYSDLPYIGLIKIKLNDSSFLINGIGNSIDTTLFWKGIDETWEPESIWIWNQLVLNSNTIIDIGANIGLYSVIAKKLNPNAKVIAFEPSKTSFQTLQKNIKSNNLEIISENIAVSNIAGMQLFYDSYSVGEPSASLSPNTFKDSSTNTLLNEYMVQSISLDQYVSDSQHVKIDLIKMDVELHEVEVFSGMHNVLQSHRPLILFEVLTDEIGEKLQSYIQNYDYDIYHFMVCDNERKLYIINNIIGQPFGNWNYFAAPKEKRALITQYLK